MKKIYRVVCELEDKPGRTAEAEEIAKTLGMPVENVEDIMGVVRDPQALEEFAWEDGAIVDPSAPSPLDHMVDQELRRKIEKTLRMSSRPAHSIGRREVPDDSEGGLLLRRGA